MSANIRVTPTTVSATTPLSSAQLEAVDGSSPAPPPEKDGNVIATRPPTDLGAPAGENVHAATNSLSRTALPTSGTAPSRTVVSPSYSTQLSVLDQYKCRFFSALAFRHYKTQTLIHALSAMKAPPHLVMINCPPHAQCRAGYSPSEHQVWMCGNHFWSPWEFRRVLTHELVHAFDFARAKIDESNLDHISCTEVRAWNLSGECDLWRNWMAFLGDDMVNRKQRCIREGSTLSLRQHRSFSGDYQISEALFRKCFKDHWPFTVEPHLDTGWRESPKLDRQ